MSREKTYTVKVYKPSAVYIAITAIAIATDFAVAETRGYVFSFMHTAVHADPRNCPKGGNGGSTETDLRAYKTAGLSEAEINAIIKGDRGPSNSFPLINIRRKRAIVDGRPARVDYFPDSLPDPHLEVVSGPLAYGFNLDGEYKNAFEDPDTGERGVDNQLFRAVGCFTSYTENLPRRPFGEEIFWRAYMQRTYPPAWVMAISGKDLSRDGDVTVSMHRAIEPIRLDASRDAMADLTYTIEPSQRAHGTFTGTMKNGVFTSDARGVELMLPGEYPFLKLELSRAQLRFTIDNKGQANGYIGGYQPWLDFNMHNMHSNENQGIDYIALYHALKRLADSEPDPKTGQNMSISATYRLETVPAFLAYPDGTFLTTNQ